MPRDTPPTTTPLNLAQKGSNCVGRTQISPFGARLRGVVVGGVRGGVSLGMLELPPGDSITYTKIHQNTLKRLKMPKINGKWQKCSFFPILQP